MEERTKMRPISKDKIREALDGFYYTLENIIENDLEDDKNLNIEARSRLQVIYNSLGSVNDNLAELILSFEDKNKNDKRIKKLEKVDGYLVKIYDIVNPMAEDEDILLV